MTNEYILKRHKERQPIADKLQAIADCFPGEWKVKRNWPLDEFPPHWIAIEEAGTDFNIMAELDHRQRFEFILGAYPHYENVGGGLTMVSLRDLWCDGDETSPRTTAAMDRDPQAIARQVERNVIEPGRRLFKKLQELAQERQAYVAKVQAAQDELAEAIGETIHRRSDQLTMYARNIPGDPLRVNFRGFESVELGSVTVPEAIAMLNTLRDLRSKVTA